MTTPVAPGQLRLFDRVVPGLDAGRYRAEGRVSGLPDGADLVADTWFSVTGPRFSVPDEDVVEIHPARDVVAAVEDRLPHVVLGRRTLPWERTVAAPPAQPFAGPPGDLGSTPWLALLVVTEQEAELVPQIPLSAGVGAAAHAAMSALDSIDGDPLVTVVKGRGAFDLRTVLPSPRSVRLLAHARQVSVADSALARGDADGWFAVVTANRLPEPVGGAPTRYHACLVSLEGRADVWQPGPAPALVVLASWPFTAATGGTFQELATGLSLRLAGTGDPLLDGAGRIALQRTDRAGTTAEVRYRGPLAPAAVPPAPPADGADDVSLEVAAELGRLLGTADGPFLRQVIAWHRSRENAIRAAAGLRVVAAALRSAPGRGPRRLAASGADSPGPGTSGALPLPASAPALAWIPASGAAAPGTPVLASLGVALLDQLAGAAEVPADLSGIPPSARNLPSPAAGSGPGALAAGRPEVADELRADRDVLALLHALRRSAARPEAGTPSSAGTPGSSR